jgi:hypothetical protein
MQADKVRDSFRQGMTIESFIGWSPVYQMRQHTHLSLLDYNFMAGYFISMAREHVKGTNKSRLKVSYVTTE